MQAADPLSALGLNPPGWPRSASTLSSRAGLRSLSLPVWPSQANLAPRAAVVAMAPSLGSSQYKPGGELFCSKWG